MPIAPHYPLYLANQPLTTTARLDVTDKYTGKRATQTSLADAAIIERAIAAGVAARSSMAELPADARRDVLLHCLRRFQERHEELAQLLCIEAGKPIRDARGEVTRLVDTFRIATEEATRINGQTLELAVSARSRGYRGFTRYLPVGLCSFITPFNFPLNLVAHKVAPAIAAGCPFILKPSSKTPLGALVIAEILAETELPAGAFSILPCSDADATPLVEDPRIALFSFTGGPIGWQLKARAGRKKVTLELGGNAACIVDAEPGATLEHIAERLIFGGYYQSGQSCISVQRVLVHQCHYPTLKSLLKARLGQLVVGNPHHEETFIGPLIDEAAARRIEGQITEALEHGATLIHGEARRENLLPPQLLENVPTHLPLYQQEAFAPVMILEAFEDFDEALARVNASDYGLQAGVFTARLDHGLRAWDRLEVGGVIIGDVPSFRVDNMPYGGVKASGSGREGVRSAIIDMSEERLLVLRG
ncbi:aldehyde dehydrogenase [Lysobacteraceae bacterium NML75-0749]|nr:aldehyde dehydrogenase [Xanthomonadaceae bacterium NML75-0749]PJK05488.1 aldehyde dehydrogenase [Xanthomonadaceae bacterium NML91-0268]